MRISPEHARLKLEERRARLVRLLELGAPEIVIAEERRMIAAAIYAVETGELRPAGERSKT